LTHGQPVSAVANDEQVLASEEWERLPLADLVEALGENLREANTRAVNREAILVLGDCSVELNVQWERSASGGVQFWVMKAEGGLKSVRGAKMIVNLTPAKMLNVARPGGLIEDAPGN
jgi:hypothetical protein